MIKNRISVIIPIYKVENYLGKCIQSVREQTYTNLQIILVDDGSPDSCGKICDNFAKLDDRIIVVHKENGGLSDARNAGLPFAEGEFVFYLDSDDYLEKNALEVLVRIQRKYAANIVVGNYFYTYSEREDIATCNYEELNLNNYDAMKALVTGKIRNFAWGKLIDTEIAKKHLFPKGKLFEDNYWAHLVFADATTVVITDKPLLHYRQRGDSISYTFSIGRLDIMEGWIVRKEFLERNYPDLTSEFLAYIAESYVGIAWLILTRMRSEKKRAFDIMRKYNKEMKLENYSRDITKRIIVLLNKNIGLYVVGAIIYKIKDIIK